MPSSIKWVFCKRNLELHTQKVYDALVSKYPDEKFEIKDCPSKDLCSLCADVPFVLRNGAIVNAKDAKDLYFKLDSSLKFLTTEPIINIPPAPPAPPKEAAAKPAPAAKPATEAAPKAEEAPKAEAAPKAEEASKAEPATKADEAPKLD